VEWPRYGLYGSASKHWLHAFPLCGKTCAYEAEDARQYISTRRVPLVTARSRNGKQTGLGFLLPAGEGFVRHITDVDYGKREEWVGLTDRQIHNRCTGVFCDYLCLPEAKGVHLQRQSIDFVGGGNYELKTERRWTGNLFVQVAEYRHNPNILPNGERKVVELR